jgi:ATPase
VIHSSEAIDAIQRFIGKIELGMIPHVVDTVIFIKDGEIKNVYELSLTVKVPTGMTEADLTRPVVEVRDFETGKLYYEIYTYGEENVVVPVQEKKVESAVEVLAKQRVKQIIDKYDPSAKIDFVSENRVRIVVDNNVIPRLIGKNGMNIAKIEEKLGIHIDVEPRIPTTGKEVSFSVSEVGNSIVFRFAQKMKGKRVDIYVNNDYLLSATVGKKNEVRVSKSSGIGKELLKGMLGNKIRVLSA